MKFLAILILLATFTSFLSLNLNLVHNKEKIETDPNEEIKKSLVTIKSRVDVPFVGDSDNIIESVGFVVDHQLGIIATTRKAARISPSLIKLQLHDGTSVDGNIIYSDPIVPFGLIKIDDHTNKKNFSSLTLSAKITNSKDFTPGNAVMIIGNSGEGTYITKKGKITNTNRNFSKRYGGLFQTSFDRVGDLAGSPVFNDNKEVIGMHIFATGTTSFELKIDYISTILSQIQAKKKITRGDIGISIDLVILGIATVNYKLPSENAEEIKKALRPTGGPPEVMVISSIQPNSNAENHLRSGDIIYKLNDRIIGDNFLLLDEILNENVGKGLKVLVSRNGKLVTENIDKVDNSQDYMITKYVSFSDADFHEVTNLVRFFTYSNYEGVYLTYAKKGSPFDKVSKKVNTKYNVM